MQCISSPVTFTNKTDHEIAEILLKIALNTITPSFLQTVSKSISINNYAKEFCFLWFGIFNGIRRTYRLSMVKNLPPLFYLVYRDFPKIRREKKRTVSKNWFGLWCLMPLSTISHLYRDDPVLLAKENGVPKENYYTMTITTAISYILYTTIPFTY